MLESVQAAPTRSAPTDQAAPPPPSQPAASSQGPERAFGAFDAGRAQFYRVATNTGTMPENCAACGKPLGKPARPGSLAAKLSIAKLREFATLPTHQDKGFHPECFACAACEQRISAAALVHDECATTRARACLPCCPSARAAAPSLVRCAASACGLAHGF